jgi:hypothetical protein
MNSIAVMQPYVFPYLGYFHLVQAASTFVFYDDVQFQPRSWMNRNRLLINGREHRFTVPCSAASQNDVMHDVQLHEPAQFAQAFLRQVQMAYRRAPAFEQGMAYLHAVLAGPPLKLAELAVRSVQQACAVLGLERRFVHSSQAHAKSRALGRAERLIAITKAEGAQCYINAPGGRELYSAEPFVAQGLQLRFVQPQLTPYPQGGTDHFVPGLSIIDVLMHNPAERVREMLTQYELSP